MGNNDSEKKVCHVTSVHNRYDVRILQKECCSLAETGYEVYLAVCDDKPDEVLSGVNIISTGYKPKSRIKRFLFSNRKLKSLIKKLNADLYHFHDPDLLGMAAFFKRMGKKVIFDSHEDVPKQILDKHWIPKSFRKPIAKIYESYEQKVVRRIDAAISVTPSVVGRLQKINSNTALVTNYPILNDEKTECVLTKNRVLCFAGGITESWNHEKILEAIEDIPNVKYLLAGKANDKYLDVLKQHRSWPKVDYRGFVSHDEVKELYCDSRIGLALNQSSQTGTEGTLGNTKLFEFMAAGIPVICTNYRLWQKIVENNNCGLVVEPSNVDEINKAVSTLLNNYDLCVQMGKNGIRAVRDKYNWEIPKAKLLSLYASLFESV